MFMCLYAYNLLYHPIQCFITLHAHVRAGIYVIGAGVHLYTYVCVCI